MRIDRKAPAYDLNRSQRYFVDCWFNMIHEHSLDSFRVRSMNPRNTLREIDRILKRGQAEDRKAVYDEAIQVLEGDPVLKQPVFERTTVELLMILHRCARAKKDEDRAQEPMLSYLVTELQYAIEQDYLGKSLEWLRAWLAEADAQAQADERLAAIHAVTGHLLSTLIDRGASLESLYNLYSQVLVPRVARAGYRFDNRLDLLRRIVTEPTRERELVLVVDGVSKIDAFPRELGAFTFHEEVPFPIRRDKGGRAFVAAAGRLFALTRSHEADSRAAGVAAYDRLNQILNLVCFEYERSPLNVLGEFAVREPIKPDSGRSFRLPVLLPNPTSVLDEVPVAEFVRSVNELVSDQRFDREGRERVQAAFRLYRVGLDNALLEHKLLNWWTALEYLARGSDGGGNIGKSVESLVVPVLSLRYLGKHLLAVRNVLVDANIDLRTIPGCETLELKRLAAHELLVALRPSTVQHAVLRGLATHPYCERHVAAFLRHIGDAKLLHTMLVQHEQRLRWQIRRLYRARCDIVHSAERTVSGTLLSANLEFYLKTTLVALLQALRTHPTLSSPREFFDRQGHVYQLVQEELKSGNAAAVERIVQA